MAEESNNVSAAEVERIVREVLARLGGEKQDTATTTGQLALSERLVTLAELDGRLDGVTELVVPARAVVTPAVRDRLKERRIKLSYKKAVEPKRAALSPVVMGIAETNFDTAALIAALSREGVQIEQLARTGLVSVIGELSDEVRKGGKPAVLMTKACDAALCLANRHPGVRAVATRDAGAVRKTVAAIGANFLVLDATGKSLSVLCRIVREFLSAPKECPPELAALG